MLSELRDLNVANNILSSDLSKLRKDNQELKSDYDKALKDNKEKKKKIDELTNPSIFSVHRSKSFLNKQKI